MIPAPSAPIDLSNEELRAIAAYVYDHAGIKLDESKRELVKSRLGSRIRSLKLPSFAAYFEQVKSDAVGKERTYFVDALTTNLTYFFREDQHFTFLNQKVLLPRQHNPSPLRIWSAGCSSGEEPYTMGMLIRESLGTVELLHKCEPRILATDLSTKVLAKARGAIYPADVAAKVPEPYRSKYLKPVAGSDDSQFRVADVVQSHVRFAQLNLMGDWPMKGPFDVIFCRNVMIYFDAPTKETLVARYHKLLKKDGYFFISLSESLNGLTHPFQYVAPGIYRP